MIHASGLVFDYVFHRDPGSIAASSPLRCRLGIIASSRAFRPLHDKTRNEAYLLLPASALEKTLARLLAVTAGLVTYLLVFSTVVALVVESLNLLFFGSRNGFFNPFDLPTFGKAYPSISSSSRSTSSGRRGSAGRTSSRPPSP